MHVLRHTKCNKITRLTKARIEASFAGIEILTSEFVTLSPSSLSLFLSPLIIHMHAFFLVLPSLSLVRGSR